MLRLILLIPILLGLRHDYHVAISLVHFNAESGNIEVTHKVFIDDIEAGLQLLSGNEALRWDHLERPQRDSLLSIYCHRHFQLKTEKNSDAMGHAYVGHEVDGYELLWIYVEYFPDSPPSKLHIHNDILMAVHDDQSNICHVSGIGETRTVHFHRRKITEFLEWQP